MVYIPGFLVSKVYERGSLTNTPAGFQFSLTNRMTPLRITGMRDVRLAVDGIACKPGHVDLVLGGKALPLNEGSLEEPVTFAKDSRLVVRVRGSTLQDGKHTIRISFITNEHGGATLKVSDVVGDRKPHFLWRWMNRFFSWPARAVSEQPVCFEGELAGIPLDPDFSRLEAALRRQEPDRVPLFEAEIAVPIQEAFLGREIGSARDEVEFYVRAGYDFVPVLPPFFAPRLMRSASDDDGTLSDDDLERTWVSGSEGIIETLKDVEEFAWPKAEEVDFSSFQEIAELLPPKMKTLGMLVPAAVFGNASQAMGLENFSYALYDDPHVVEALFQIVGSTYVQIAKRLVKQPRVGAVLMADDLAYSEGCLVSPEVYRKYVFPWYKQIGEVLANAGLPFIFHSDGKLWDVLDDLADCGVNAIHPIEPQAMDIAEVKKRYGDRFCIFGNIDLEYTLTRGSVEEVEQLVKTRLRELAPGGGYGVAASNSVPDYVKPENYRAMVEAVKRHGKYPIDC